MLATSRSRQVRRSALTLLMVLAATLLVQSALQSSRAEVIGDPAALKLQCNSAGDEATMSAEDEPADKLAVKQIDGRDGADCIFANGTTIRVKVIGIQDCTMALSLWVNRSKVLSLFAYYTCEGAIARLRVTSQEIEICGGVGTSNDAGDPDDRPLAARLSECRHLPIPGPEAKVDTVEYAPPGAPPKPVAGNLVLNGVSDDRICGEMKIVNNRALHEQELEPPEGSTAIDWKPLPKSQFAGDNSWAEFDFDNDGIADWVWQREDWSHMGQGTYFALTPKGTKLDSTWFDQPDDPPEKGRAAVYSGTRSEFNTWFVHWQIFLWQQRTYAISEPVVGDTVVVATPEKGRFRSLCSFDRVPENY